MAALYVFYLTIAALPILSAVILKFEKSKQIETFGWCLEAEELVGIPIAMPSS